MILAGEDVPSNNERRKKLYRQLTLMLNDGPLGAGVRRPLCRTVVSQQSDTCCPRKLTWDSARSSKLFRNRIVVELLKN
jgi:hypothetical protein